MVHIDEVKELMDQMLKTPILRASEKNRMLENERTFLDPNLIMDERHKIFRKTPLLFTENYSVTNGKRLLAEQEAKEFYLKKEQERLEAQLKNFEKELNRSRPKFGCSKKTLADSSDEDFWRVPKGVKVKVARRERNKNSAEKKSPIIEEIDERSIDRSTSETPRNVTEPSFGSIQVTIKDKPTFRSEEERLKVMRRCFEALRENVKEEKRLRDVKTKIQENLARKTLRRYFRTWRSYVQAKKKSVEKQKREQESSEVRKIEKFVSVITEKQKELKVRKSFSADSMGVVFKGDESEVKERKSCSRRVIVESPAQNRLNAQREIIERQRTKLAEQNKIIEELRLKQVQEEISRAGRETINAAKDTLTHCGQRTRRTLIQLMRQAGYRDKSLLPVQRAPSPPRFLVRMEARAEARRERVRKAEEARRRKLEEQKEIEEAARREEEQERRRLQQEALREARRLREEQEQCRAREAERFKRLNEQADEFHRRYLLRRYIMEPFFALIEMKNNYIQLAEDHYKKNLMRKSFEAWRMEAENQNVIKTELATSVYHRNLLWYCFEEWKRMHKEEKQKLQVARDFCDMKLQEKSFKFWRVRVLEYRNERLENEELAREHYERKLKIKCLRDWKRYTEIIDDIRESEKIKDDWRQIVQEVIPDFNPRRRGIALDD